MSATFAKPTLLRRLKGILQRFLKTAFEMSYIPFVLYVIYKSLRQLCKISSRFAKLTFFRRLKNISPRCLECLHKTIFTTSLRSLFANWERRIPRPFAFEVLDAKLLEKVRG